MLRAAVRVEGAAQSVEARAGRVEEHVEVRARVTCRACGLCVRARCVNAALASSCVAMRAELAAAGHVGVCAQHLEDAARQLDEERLLQ